MAGSALALAMQISANTAGLAQGIKDVESKLDRMAGAAEKTAGRMKVLSSIAIGASFVKGIQMSVQAFRGLQSMTGSFVSEAASLEQAMGKTGAVFGSAAEGVVEFAKSTASIGIAKKDALEAASTMGNLFTAFGVGRENAASMSVEMVKLAADMAALSNTPIEQALTAISSGLAGEQEPLKRYGVVLSEAVLKEKAFAQGLIQTRTAALDPLTRSLMAYQVLLDQTANAQGHAAREADTLDGSQKRMAAAFSEIREAIGNALVPAYREFGAAIMAAGPAMKEAALGFAEFASKLDLRAIFTSMTTTILKLAEVFGKLVAVLAPVVQTILPAVAGVVGVIADNFDHLMAMTVGAGVALGVYTAVSAAAAISTAGFTATLVAARAAMVAFMSSTGVGALVALGGAVLGSLVMWATSADDAATETDAMAGAAQAAAAAQQEFASGSEAVASELEKIGLGANKATEALYKFKAATDQDFAQGVLSELESEYKKLAQAMGGERNIPKQIRDAMSRQSAGVDLVNDFGGRPEDVELMLKTTEEVLKMTRDRLFVEQQIAEINRAKEGPENNLAATYEQMRQAQEAFLAAQRRGDVEAMQAIESRFSTLQQVAEKAKADILKANGLDPKDFEGPEKAAGDVLAKFDAVRDLFSQGLLNQVDLNTYMNSLQAKHDEIVKSIESSINSADKSSVSNADVRTREGFKEFMRLSTGGSDPGVKISAQQLGELRAIRRVLGRPQVVEIGA